MRILKVKYNGSRVLVEYERDNEHTHGVDKFTVESLEEPRPDFKKAFTNLVPHVCAICELPSEYGENVEVRGVTFSWRKGAEERNMGATISCKRNVEATNSPFVFSTPHVPNLTGTERDDEPEFQREAAKALQQVLSETALYIQGERAQVEMFEEER